MGEREKGVTGVWRVTEMDAWDQEAFDLVGPAFFDFEDGRSGRFRFIAVEGWMDCRPGERAGRARVTFSFDGNDECDPASGRGWAEVAADGALRGHIFIHAGEDSGFRAVRTDRAEVAGFDPRSRRGSR